MLETNGSWQQKLVMLCILFGKDQTLVSAPQLASSLFQAQFPALVAQTAAA